MLPKIKAVIFATIALSVTEPQIDETKGQRSYIPCLSDLMKSAPTISV